MSAERVAAVLAAHSIGAFSGSETACVCDRWWRPNAEYRQHLAEALAEAGLPTDQDQRETRIEWATGFSGDPTSVGPVLSESGARHDVEGWNAIRRSAPDGTGLDKAALYRREVGSWVEVPS